MQPESLLLTHRDLEAITRSADVEERARRILLQFPELFDSNVRGEAQVPIAITSALEQVPRFFSANRNRYYCDYRDGCYHQEDLDSGPAPISRAFEEFTTENGAVLETSVIKIRYNRTQLVCLVDKHRHRVIIGSDTYLLVLAGKDHNKFSTENMEYGLTIMDNGFNAWFKIDLGQDADTTLKALTAEETLLVLEEFEKFSAFMLGEDQQTG